MTKPEKGQPYTCALCGGTFIAESDRADVDKEFVETFPGEDVEDVATVCDPCYVSGMAYAKAQGWIP